MRTCRVFAQTVTNYKPAALTYYIRIIELCISQYLSLCVSGGLSKSQSHIAFSIDIKNGHGFSNKAHSEYPSMQKRQI